MDKSKIKFFWTYTIILFAAAFALILFVALAGSQHLEFRDDAKETFQHNSEMLNEMAQTLSAKESQISALSETIKSLNEKIDVLEVEKTSYSASAEAILEAEKLLNAGNYSGAKKALETVKPEVLTSNLKTLYDTLSRKLN